MSSATTEQPRSTLNPRAVDLSTSVRCSAWVSCEAFSDFNAVVQFLSIMSGCQEALLLTRQPTPAVPLQEVSCVSNVSEIGSAKPSSAHRSLSHLESIPEDQLQSTCQQACYQSERRSSTDDQTAVLLKEKFPEQAQYTPPSLRRQSPQGSCNLPTVFSGQLMTAPL